MGVTNGVILAQIDEVEFRTTNDLSDDWMFDSDRRYLITKIYQNIKLPFPVVSESLWLQHEDYLLGTNVKRDKPIPSFQIQQNLHPLEVIC